jgi:hypothetical protein
MDPTPNVRKVAAQRRTDCIGGITHMNGPRMIVVEFNELCPALLDRFMHDGLLPNFRSFYEHSDAFITQADAEPPALEPWIQWYSVHTGLSYQQHRVFNLTDGPRARHRDIWDILTAHGKTVANCSSMNAKSLRARDSFFLPDPWCDSEVAYPDELNIFYRFVRHHVQEYTNESQSLSLSDYSALLLYLFRHGLSTKTIAAVLKQLVAERVRGKDESWRRAPLLDQLQFDVFRYYYRRAQPQFATFFSNSTAHYQHSYWRYMDPEAFSMPASSADLLHYGDAILFGYQSMDALLGELCELADSETLVVLATALSQQPFTRLEHIGGQNFFRPKNIESLLGLLGIGYQTVQAVMTHQYILHFGPGQSIHEAMRRIEGVKYAGREVFDCRESNDGGLYFGSQIHTPPPEDACIEFGDQAAQIGFHELFYRIKEVKSGFHHPDGVLWLRTGRHSQHTPKVSVLDIFPTILDYFRVELPAEERSPYRGKSLLQILGAGQTNAYSHISSDLGASGIAG